MNNELHVGLEDDHVKVIANGDKNLEFAKDMWTRVTAFCRENNCYRVLGLANSSTPLSYSEAFEIVTLFQELSIREPYKIAWVELNPDAYDAIDLTELLLRLRSYPVRLFSEENAAKHWLLESAPE